MYIKPKKIFGPPIVSIGEYIEHGRKILAWRELFITNKFEFRRRRWRQLELPPLTDEIQLLSRSL